MYYETASTTDEPRGEHKGTIKRLRAPLRDKDKIIIHSPQSSPRSLELGTTNVNETHTLQNDQGVVEF